jgi:eukaryotic-like serine/threonine-protein kinase
MISDRDQQPLVNQCPECQGALDVTALAPFSKITCPHCQAAVRVRTTMGQYQILHLVGEGGMSQVFRAVDCTLGREVALKVLHQSLSEDAILTAKFEQEAKLTAAIVHPNVVKVFTVGKDHGYFFIAMELVEAASLEETIARSGAISEAQVLRIAHDVTCGLQAAMDANLIHRDIKPGNMLVTQGGVTKLVDFGLAVQQGGAEENEELWATPFYVPPEKLIGETDTFQGDIYSLGATLFHALAGKPPFEANTASLDELITIKRQPISLRKAAAKVSADTIALVERMMAYTPAERPASYAEIIEQIDGIEKKRQEGKRARLRNMPRRKKGYLGLAAAALLTVMVIIILKWSGSAPSVNDTAGVGIAGEDRVIAAGENRRNEAFLKARQRLILGEGGNLAQTFSELAQSSDLAPATRRWCRFFQGVTLLQEGKEREARDLLREATAIPLAANESPSDDWRFLEKAGSAFSEELPPLFEEEDWSAGAVDALGYLVGGLKTWQMGQFKASQPWFSAYLSSAPPTELAWLGEAKGLMEKYRADYEIFISLPNPVRSAGPEALKAQSATLQAALGRISTKGALPGLIKERLRRIEEILSDPQVPGQSQTTRAAVSNNPSMSSSPSTFSSEAPRPSPTWSQEERVEMEQLAATWKDLRGDGNSLWSPGAVLKLEQVSVTTPLGRRRREDLMAVFTAAEGFFPILESSLRQKPYKGEVLRRQGIPLKGVLTAKDASTLILDLSFGENEVPVEIFDPKWLVTVAAEALATTSNPAAWESIFAFSFLNGGVTATELDSARLDSAAQARWERLKVE